MKVGIEVFAYLADAAILAAYAMVTSGKYVVRLFHWTNALGCIPILLSEVIVGAWPAMVLTFSFGAIGWVGLVSGEKVSP